MLFPVLLLEFRARGKRCLSTWRYWVLDSSETCFEHVFVSFFIYRECSVFWVKRFLLWALCCLCCSAKACRNVSLTDASSYLPRAVVGFKPRGRRVCDLPKHMLLVLSPSTMTETRTVSVRSSLMADKVTFEPEWIFHSCTQEFARAYDKWPLRYSIKISSHIIILSVVCSSPFFYTSFSWLLFAFSCLSFNKHLLYSRNILCHLLHQKQITVDCHFHSFVRIWQIWIMKSKRQQIFMNIWEISLLDPGQHISLDLINFFTPPSVKINILTVTYLFYEFILVLLNSLFCVCYFLLI